MNVVSFPSADRGLACWEPWVGEAVIARHFGISDRTVRRWRAQGMPSRLIGEVRRYRISACETWHERRESP